MDDATGWQDLPVVCLFTDVLNGTALERSGTATSATTAVCPTPTAAEYGGLALDAYGMATLMLSLATDGAHFTLTLSLTLILTLTLTLRPNPNPNSNQASTSPAAWSSNSTRCPTSPPSRPGTALPVTALLRVRLG